MKLFKNNKGRGLTSHMVKKNCLICVLSIFVLVGCSDDLHSESSNDRAATNEESKQKDSSRSRDEIKINDFSKINVISLDESDDNQYKFPDLKIENAECIVFQPIHLKKSEKITLTFQLQSNDSINNLSIGVIKDFSPDSNVNYEIEKINSESIDNELAVTYTSQADSNYSFSILGTMADTVAINNGKMTN